VAVRANEKRLWALGDAVVEEFGPCDSSRLRGVPGGGTTGKSEFGARAGAPALARVPPAAPAPGTARRGEAAMSRKQLKAVMTDAETDEFFARRVAHESGEAQWTSTPKAFPLLLRSSRATDRVVSHVASGDLCAAPHAAPSRVSQPQHLMPLAPWSVLRSPTRPLVLEGKTPFGARSLRT
jgi:hypothetical protein